MHSIAPTDAMTMLENIHHHAHTARRHRMYVLVYMAMGQTEKAALARQLADNARARRDAAILAMAG